LILYPEGNEFRAARPADGEPTRIAIPVESFCRLRRGGSSVVRFIAPIRETVAATNETPDAGRPRVAIDPVGADGAALLFEEACPERATASR
jgi:hypothetical protein